MYLLGLVRAGWVIPRFGGPGGWFPRPVFCCHYNSVLVVPEHSFADFFIGLKVAQCLD